MTERTHIQRFYRQRFAELHTRKLRVNSHRKNLGSKFVMRWLVDGDDFLTVLLEMHDGVEVNRHEWRNRMQPLGEICKPLDGIKVGFAEAGQDWM